MNEEFRIAEKLFLEAIELKDGQVQPFLENRIPENEGLREEIQNLVDCHRRSEDDDFILDQEPAVVGENEEPLPIGEQVGDWIGPYKLLEQIGEGGMGVVYMAEQQQGVIRKVALKIIKLGMDTRHVVARFEAERQALALFDHPNIARVFDVGATETGRPYFAMELVRGTDIVEFVKTRKINLRRRLELFVAVCQAIQHAHQKGIIHRDLKPTNVLVSLSDGIPTPKIIDFGIAKAVGQKLTDRTLFTKFTATMGTPLYMSPEQANQSGSDVDTRSDIYSLGVILYELITGTTPVDSSVLNEINPLAIFETLRDFKIQSPSSKVTKSSDIGAELWRLGQQDSSSLKRIKNELDWVVLKALASDRRERYQSAHDLAKDVLRFIHGEPVHAAPPTLFRTVGNFVRKNRMAMLAASLIGLLLTAGAVSGWLFAMSYSRVNAKLKTALHDSQANLNRALAAEKKQRFAYEQLMVSNANAIAVEKFLTKQMDKYKEVHNQYCLQAISEGKGKFVCLGNYYDELRLMLRFPSLRAFDLPTAHLVESINQMDSDRSEIENFEHAEIDSNLAVHKECSDLCTHFRDRVRQNIPGDRVLLFRLLLEEYQNSFGHDDPKVAVPLTLLAASFSELGKRDEAIANLEKAVNVSLENVSALKRMLAGLNQ